MDSAVYLVSDASPRWSPDGKKASYLSEHPVRLPLQILRQQHLLRPYNRQLQQVVAEEPHSPGLYGRQMEAMGKGAMLWKAAESPRRDCRVRMVAQICTGQPTAIVFCSYQDGWPHMYSINPDGGELTLLTPGEFQAEQIKLSSDGNWLIFSGNTGPDKQLDIDRRHVVRVSVDKADMEVLTPGAEMETYPILTGDGIDGGICSAQADSAP